MHVYFFYIFFMYCLFLLSFMSVRYPYQMWRFSTRLKAHGGRCVCACVSEYELCVCVCMCEWVRVVCVCLCAVCMCVCLCAAPLSPPPYFTPLPERGGQDISHTHKTETHSRIHMCVCMCEGVWVVCLCAICPSPLSPPHFDCKKPPPPGGLPIRYVPSSRNRRKRTLLVASCTNSPRGVLLLRVLD